MQTPLLRYTQALAMIEDSTKPTDSSPVAMDKICGRVLAERVRARVDSPVFDTSAMDGYAVRVEDVAGAGPDASRTLAVSGVIHAGDGVEYSLGEGVAFKIMTGARVPNGAGAVVMVERTRSDGERVEILHEALRWENIRRQGSEFSVDEVLISKGIRVGAIERGVMLSQGIAEVKAYDPVGVSVLVTGDELVDPSEVPTAGKIRDVNTYTLAESLRGRGNPVVRAERIGDTREGIRAALVQAAGDSQIVLTTGGVSMGDKDYVADELKAAGFEIVFHGVAVKPGKPLVFAVHRETGCVAFGLPGNVVSAMMGYHLFVQPALRRMEGQSEWKNESWFVRCGALVHNPGARTNFIRARVSHTPSGMPIAFPTGEQGSGMLTSMLGADGAMVVPADVDTVSEFCQVEFIPFDDC